MGNCFGLCRERPDTYATMVASESVTAEPSIAGVEEEVLAGQTFGLRAEPSIQNEEAEDLEFISHSFICNDDVVRVLQTMKVRISSVSIRKTAVHRRKKQAQSYDIQQNFRIT